MTTDDIPDTTMPITENTVTEPTAPQPAEPWLTPSEPAPGPPNTSGASQAPIRWGGVVWGLALIIVAASTLVAVSAPARVVAVEVWLAALTPGTAVALWVAAVGVLIVMFAVLGAIRSAQRRRHAS